MDVAGIVASLEAEERQLVGQASAVADRLAKVRGVLRAVRGLVGDAGLTTRTKAPNGERLDAAIRLIAASGGVIEARKIQATGGLRHPIQTYLRHWKRFMEYSGKQARGVFATVRLTDAGWARAAELGVPRLAATGTEG